MGLRNEAMDEKALNIVWAMCMLMCCCTRSAVVQGYASLNHCMYDALTLLPSLSM
jgi:hypothetical protein